MIDTLLLTLLLAAAIIPLGRYIANVYLGEPVFMGRMFGWLERGFYAASGIDSEEEMTWRRYAGSLLLFSLFGFVLLYAILLLQGMLPFNPQHAAGVSPDLAFNVAISFLTNTNWQSYGGESTLSHFSQMAGLTVQNFASAAAGMAVAVALFRGFVRKQMHTIGNFWVDLTRSILYILLPLSVMYALLLASQGVVQNFKPDALVTTLQGAEQHISIGPVASQIAIKQLGSNGGGFFNANSAHPFENPTPFSNLLEILGILLIPVSLVYAYGQIIKDRRQAWCLLAAMIVVFLPLLFGLLAAEHTANPLLAALPLDNATHNMEGKEVRFGTDLSALWAAATTATSNGSVNAMHGSFMPMGKLCALLLMQFGEVIFGGVGTGMVTMLMFVVVTVFIGGLMVGRTPEYLGKKLGPFEIKMATLIIILPTAFVLIGTCIAVLTEAGRAGMLNPGAAGFSEILYAFTSAANNNGSALAGLSANTPFYNVMLGIVMFFGRFVVLIPALAMAGSLAAKNAVPESAGTLATHTPLFVVMLIMIIILIGLLTYVPCLALGPIVEHLQLFGGVAL